MDSHVAVEVSLEGQACLCVCVFSCLCLLHARSWEGGNIWCLTYSWRRQDGCEQSWEHGLHQRLPVSSCAPLAVSSCRPLHFLCPLSSAHIPVVRGVVIFCNSQWRICCILLMKIPFFFFFFFLRKPISIRFYLSIAQLCVRWVFDCHRHEVWNCFSLTIHKPTLRFCASHCMNKWYPDLFYFFWQMERFF